MSQEIITNCENTLDTYKTENFHKNMKLDWPEVPEQLHCGGWEMTYKMVNDIKEIIKNHNNSIRVLDLCCGEGSTAVFLSKQYKWEMYGIDCSPHVILKAKKLNELNNTNVSFITCSAFELPFENNYFDVIIGQDPDAFADIRRPQLFSECRRVLRPGGIIWLQHHWIPGYEGTQEWSDEEIKEYSLLCGTSCSSAKIYIDDAKQEGFDILKKKSINKISRKHLKLQALNQQKRRNNIDDWLRFSIKMMSKGLPFGIQLVLYKTL